MFNEISGFEFQNIDQFMNQPFEQHHQDLEPSSNRFEMVAKTPMQKKKKKNMTVSKKEDFESLFS